MTVIASRAETVAKVGVAGSNPVVRSNQCDVARHRKHLEPPTRWFRARVGTRWKPEGLVVLGRIDAERSDELARCRVDDAHVEVMDQHDHPDAANGDAEADVVHAALDPQRDASGLVR
jgi:hypothetical protein